MPESVDIPAPVSATQLRPRRRSAAASNTVPASTLTAKPYSTARNSADGAGAVQAPSRLRERAGERWINGERAKDLVHGEPICHGDGDWIDQLAGSWRNHNATDHDPGSR